MTLREKQSKFLIMVAQLIMYASMFDGYALTLGDGYRSPKVTYGHPNSLHRKRLAVDLNLFIDGVYQRTPAAYEPLGSYWKKLGGSWGGDFNDARHFSLAHGGMR